MPLVAILAMLFVAACGSEDSSTDTSTTGGTPATTDEGGEAGGGTEALFAGSAVENLEDLEGGKPGGSLTMVSSGDVTFLDPGKSYYSYDWAIESALHRTLYSYGPTDEEPVPDLAESEPEISEDGKTVTIKIRKGVMFSAPVKREVTSADFKYAIERAYTANVNNGYARAYIDLEGVPAEPGPYKEISGIETPDDQTLVLHLNTGTGAIAAGALSLPISAPVPQEYAEKYDQENPSTYGEGYAVYTGPYMVESDDQGKAIGYKPGKTIHIVRNPDYSDVGDYRPAYVDEYNIEAGNEDLSVATRRILGGENFLGGDIEPPASQLERLLESDKESLSAVPSGGWRLISMDTSRPPFDDLDVRKAVVAGFNRIAARQQRGGEAIGPIAQHYLPPGIGGFEESGGVEGNPDYDWMQDPEGDEAVSAKYFKAAGYSSGKYEGDEKILMVADGTDPDKSIAQIAEQEFTRMGFDVTLRLVTRDTMFNKFCNVRDSEANVCPSVGWLKDFNDPQTLLDLTFNGKNILDAGNSNWPELDDPAINAAFEKAKLLTDTDERNQAYADINDMIVAQAPGIPYMWDYQVNVVSPNVRGVQSQFSTLWDLSFTSVR